ncbi:uncharacterized protein [Typha angustifolia]|uniref:uncharacterized protein n=1 Tax=Typha angustifolia TaxID=59011 RepID=UPI003C30B180
MASFAEFPVQPRHVRSFSAPLGSHPLAHTIKEELQKMKNYMALSAPSALTTCDGLRGLGELYNCIDELLRLPHNREALCHPHQRKWLEEELEVSVKVLDLCGIMRDSFARIKEQVQDLQLALRRRETDIKIKVNSYIRFGKKAQKDVKNCYRLLKQMNGTSVSCSTSDDDLTRILKEAKEVTIYTLQSVIASFSASKSSKATRWSFVSKVTNKRKVACEGEDMDTNYMRSIDLAFCSCKDTDDGRVLKVENQLKTLESMLNNLEMGLECLFRRLIQSRVSLLNIQSL